MKRIMAVTAVVLVALLAMGLGFARWAETLTVHGEVRTGTVDVEFSPPTVSKPLDVKNVSTFDARIEGNDLYITIGNAYPCINYEVTFDVTCRGTIPVHVTPLAPEVSPDPFPGDFTWSWFTLVDGEEVPARPPVQLHQGETVYGRVSIHLNNTALQDSTLTFRIPIDAGQYNEPLLVL